MTDKPFIERLLKLVAEHEFHDSIYWNRYLQFFVRCSDVFAWACADMQPIAERDLAMFEQAIKDGGDVRDGEGVEPSYNTKLQPVLHQRGAECRCCGVGALFLSYVRLNNKATYGHGLGYGDILSRTQWPEENMGLIELAFEQGGGRNREGWCYDGPSAVAFGKQYGESIDRLKAILNNIIDSKDGLFHP